MLLDEYRLQETYFRKLYKVIFLKIYKIWLSISANKNLVQALLDSGSLS